LKIVIDFLKSTGIFNDTLIIIMSDHGENFNLTQLKINDEIPCGSHGVTLYDAELRIPLIYIGSRLPGCVAIIKKSFSGILRRAATGNLPFSINML